MRIPPLFWLIFAVGVLSAAALFGVMNAWKNPPPEESATQTKELEQKPREPIHGWLQIETESPVPPTKIEIFREGVLLAQIENPGLESAQGGEFVFPPGGLTLGVYARWDDFLPGPRAVRFKATFEGTEISSFTLWGKDEEASGVWRLPSIEIAEEPDAASLPPQ